MCFQSCSSAPGWLQKERAGVCLQLAEQMTARGPGGMSGVGLPSSTALRFPLFQADFFPRIRQLPALPAASIFLKDVSLPFSL